MRLAYAIGSPEGSPTPLPELTRFIEQLAGPSLRFRTSWLDPEEGLLRLLEKGLARRAGPGQLLLVWAGTAQVRDEDVVLALRDDEVSLRAVVEALAASELEALLLLDLSHEGPDDPFEATELVQRVREVVRPSETGIGLLVSCGAAERQFPVAPAPLLRLTSRAATLMEREASGTGSVSAQRVYQAMRELSEFDELSVAGFFPGRSAFPLVLEPSVVVSDPASIPPPAVSDRPPSSSIPESVRLGDEHYEAGRHDAAIAEYKKRLLTLPPRDPGRADVYFRIGRVKRAQGSAAEAAHNFDKALELDPMHAGALDEVCAVALEQRDFARLEAMRRRRFDALTDLDAKVRELRAIARAYLEAAASPKQAVTVLEQWIALRADEEAHALLVEAEDEIGRASARVAARRRMAAVQEPADRARTLIAAATIAERHLAGSKEAAELAADALRADPSALEALEIAARVLGGGRRWRQLADLYDEVIASTESSELVWDLSKRLGALFREQLDDAEGALAAFARAAEQNPSDVELLLWIAELYEAKREHADAAAVLRAAACVRPTEPELVRRALWAFEKTQQTDAAWQAACILDHLGEADINESLLADMHRPEGLIPARATVPPTELGRLVPERDRALTTLLAAVAPIAGPLRAEELRAEKRLPALDPKTLQDPESTTTLGRSLAWTCRLLQLPVPELYVLDGVDGTLSALPLEPAVALADSRARSGMDLAELSFLWARALVALRPENSLAVLFPSAAELARCMLAALTVGEARGLGEVDGAVQRLAERMREELDDEQLEAIAEAAAEVSLRGARRRIEEWLRVTTLAGGRAGVLVAGDVRLAVDVTRRFPLPGIEVEEQVQDLYRFALSTELGALRKLLGIDVRG